jgi:hypothetical protein
MPCSQVRELKFIDHKTVSFGQSGYPNGGAWKQTFPVSGCGNDTILNLISSLAPTKVNTAIGIPGTTLADPILQRDAVQYANIGSSLAAKDSRRCFSLKTQSLRVLA